MQIRRHDLRFILVFFALLFGLGFFIVKLILIQIFNAEHLASLAAKQHNQYIKLDPLRGMILDRNLRPFAVNITMYSLYANPRIMTDEEKAKALERLPKIIAIDRALLKDRLSKDKLFVWIKRKLPKEMMEEIKSLRIGGLDFVAESKRFYPNGSLAAHVIGFAGVDNLGLEGIELNYNKYLQGEPGRRFILRDAKQRGLIIEKNYLAPKDGYNIVLTIDETIQYITEQALKRGIEKHHAKAGTAIVMDIRTGEILALANSPTYNLEEAAKSNPESRTNRAVTYVYEPGSIFKIVTASAALEENAFVETDKIYCENGSYRIANHTLTDHTPHGTLTFSQVIEKSSNIGTVKIAQKLGADIIYKYGKLFRFGQRTGIDLQGEVNGWLKETRLWSKTTIGAIPIGYEITATPIQLVSVMASIANDGQYMRPFVVKYIKDNHGEVVQSTEPQVLDRTISMDTSRRLREILTRVVDQGTAKAAAVKGVKVGGKTGTARKVVNGAYARGKYYASFVGFAPTDNPRIAAIVVVDEPYPSYFGGTVSAPIFKEIMENSLKYLETTDYYNLETVDENAAP